MHPKCEACVGLISFGCHTCIHLLAHLGLCFGEQQHSNQIACPQLYQYLSFQSRLNDCERQSSYLYFPHMVGSRTITPTFHTPSERGHDQFTRAFLPQLLIQRSHLSNRKNCLWSGCETDPSTRNKIGEVPRHEQTTIHL